MDMDGSSSTSKNEKIPAKIVDKEDIVLSFGNFALGKDGTFGLGAAVPAVTTTSIPSSKGSSSSNTNSYRPRPPGTGKLVADDGGMNFLAKKMGGPWVWDPEGKIGGTPTLVVDSFADLEKMWPRKYFMSGGKVYVPGYDAGNSSLDPGEACSSTSGFLINHSPSFGPTGLDNFNQYYGFGEVGNNGIYSYNYECGMTNKNLMNFNEPKLFVFALEIMKRTGSPDAKDRLVFLLKGSMSKMISDETYIYFQMVIDFLEEKHLNELIPEILADSDLFLSALFCYNGANAIVKVVKKLKKSDLAFEVTRILSTKFFDIMTHNIARIVIQQCLNFLGNGPNEILYDHTIRSFQDLATHEVGCRSLNDCIDTISGNQRMRLLNSIADVSDFLSNDPYGNYVVQHVLDLKNDPVTSRILARLKGQFTLLALKKGGSHVVEKCIESCDNGIVFVVQEILETPKAPSLLARDQYGNYVIQKALEKTKQQGYSGLYLSLVQAIESYRSGLNRTRGGKHVLYILKSQR